MSNQYDIGTVRAEWKIGIDGYKVDYSDLHGFSLYAFLQSPSDEELEKMSMNADLVVFFDDLDGVGFFTFDFSGTGGSAAFVPSLLLDYPTFSFPEHLNTYPMTIYVIDSSKGELLRSRSLSFDDKFSKWLLQWCCINDTLNLTLDKVKAISQKYFSSLNAADKKHQFKIAYESSKRFLNHDQDLIER